MKEKQYDRQYFDRWYRSPEYRIGSKTTLRRKVTLSVAMAEAVLERPLRSVLDIGCGEGRWQPVLARLRPKASYLGLDPSPYVVERFGRRRNLLTGGFADLGGMRFERPFDLVVCSDVLHYLDRKTIETGLERVAPLVGGVALLETFSSNDDIEGDHQDFRKRSASTYRRMFWDAGLVPAGMQHYVRADTVMDLATLAVFP